MNYGLLGTVLCVLLVCLGRYLARRLPDSGGLLLYPCVFFGASCLLLGWAVQAGKALAR